MTSNDVVFKAIAHPARRKIISLLSEADYSVKELTTAFEMTQPAVSQHLRELREAQLVASKKVGMQQIYTLTGQPLRIIFEWSGNYRHFFDPAGHAWAFVQARVANGKRPKTGDEEHGD